MTTTPTPQPRKTPKMEVVELRFGEPLEVLLARWYLGEGLTQTQIADRLGVRQCVVSQWLHRLRLVGANPTRRRPVRGMRSASPRVVHQRVVNKEGSERGTDFRPPPSDRAGPAPLA